jgi:hypothetical protein
VNWNKIVRYLMTSYQLHRLLTSKDVTERSCMTYGKYLGGKGRDLVRIILMWMGEYSQWNLQSGVGCLSWFSKLALPV